MARQSAGLLAYRIRAGQAEFFLVHPGGPFWRNKDNGAWSIPKGEITDDEEPMTAAVREFREETGVTISGEFFELRPVKQRGGKTVQAWLVAADFDAAQITCNLFTMEWPPRSGKLKEFPEVDRAGWFDFETANEKILEAQRPILLQANERLIQGGTFS